MLLTTRTPVAIDLNNDGKVGDQWFLLASVHAVSNNTEQAVGGKQHILIGNYIIISIGCLVMAGNGWVGGGRVGVMVLRMMHNHGHFMTYDDNMIDLH